MKTFLNRLVLSAIFLALWPPKALADHVELQLICVSPCNVEPLSAFQLKKLFLGISYKIPSGETLIPLRNYSDERLKEAFHQTVIGMSEKSYNRKLLQARMNFAAKDPQVIEDEVQLFEMLAAVSNSVSVAWSDSEIMGQEGVKMVQVLWSGED